MKMTHARFALVLLISLGVMFVLSMSMVRTIDHFHVNPSNFYMALTMVAAMAVVMLVAMWRMFADTRGNVVALAAAVAVFVGAFWLGRTETGVGDEGFLRSMIPHHSRAILVCQESSITDPQIEDLCTRIVEAQREEIGEMERILERY